MNLLGIVVCVGLLLFFGVACFISYTKESREYRRLVTKPEDLLTKSAEFAIIERPNIPECYVTVFGCRFSNHLVLRKARADVEYLRKQEAINRKIKVDFSHLYDERKPLPVELFNEKLKEYEHKYSLWVDKDQGRPKQKERPVAPYDFSRLTVARSQLSQETVCY